MIKHRCALLIVLAALTQLMAISTRARWNEGVVTSWDGAHIHYIESARAITADSEGHQLLSVLFVPGYTMPAWVWEKQIGHFSNNYNVVAMDLRSQGESSKTGEGDYPVSHARDIKALMTNCTSRESCWSAGPWQ